ncbi:O-acyltransferase WSD1 [Rhynchospora pubera]|uniref:O-acyltransferase WSD1 n=1 Tax=Rhynchospora pubera TaxID=906938 RepID=A0AAV8DG41_9POAL|nr:O-acyltransferase WSD1 [Rhynchospora pubera]
MAASPDELHKRKRPPKINTEITAEKATAECKNEWDGEPVSPAGRLFHEPNFNCHVICIMGSDTPINVDTFIEGIQATIVKHPRFSSIPALNESDSKKVRRWRPVEVNVKDHIIIPSLSPDPTSPSSNDRLVEDYVSSLTVTTMDHSRPLWEFHIINIPTTESKATVVLRCHHSLGDGMSLTSLLLACTRRADDPTKLPSLPEPPRRSGPLYAQPRPGNDDGVGAFLLWIFSFIVLFWHTLVDMMLFVASSLFLRDTETPIKGHKGVEGEHTRKRFVHRTIRLEDIKTVKNAMGCTVNDVLLGVTSAALSRYLYRKHCDTKDEKKFPRNIRVRSTLLVNIRPTPGMHALAEMMESGKNGAKYGNHLGYMVLQFPIVIHEDPLDYVRQGKAIATRKKSSLEAVLTYFSADLIVKLFGIKFACTLTRRVLMNTTLSFSNLVGPIEQISFYGHPVAYIAPSVYGHPQALTVHYQSYMNTMKVVMAVDDSVIPDSHQLLDDFAESVTIIKDAAENLSKKN